MMSDELSWVRRRRWSAAANSSFVIHHSSLITAVGRPLPAASAQTFAAGDCALLCYAKTQQKMAQAGGR
jgi:hypothetical protein